MPFLNILTYLTQTSLGVSFEIQVSKQVNYNNDSEKHLSLAFRQNFQIDEKDQWTKIDQMSLVGHRVLDLEYYQKKKLSF